MQELIPGEKMEFQKVVASRRTVREFENKRVATSVLKRIIRDGMLAPSNSHVRKWYFINVVDRDLRKTLVGSEGENLLREREVETDIRKTGITDNASQDMYRYAIPKQASMILDAAVVLIPTFHQPFPLMEPKERKHLNYFASIWMCIENILLSAVEEGIFGVTYIPNYPERIKDMLGIPTEFEIACILAMGYPGKNPRMFSPDVFNFKDIIYDNYWQNK